MLSRIISYFLFPLRDKVKCSDSDSEMTLQHYWRLDDGSRSVFVMFCRFAVSGLSVHEIKGNWLPHSCGSRSHASYLNEHLHAGLWNDPPACRANGSQSLQREFSNVPDAWRRGGEAAGCGKWVLAEERRVPARRRVFGAGCPPAAPDAAARPLKPIWGRNCGLNVQLYPPPLWAIMHDDISECRCGGQRTPPCTSLWMTCGCAGEGPTFFWSEVQESE